MLYIPLSYFFKTRAKTFLHRGSFFILIVFPLFAFFYEECVDLYELAVFPIFVVAFIAMFSVYEIGYLYNDFETTRFEEMPSYWMPMEEHNRFERAFEKMIAARVVYATICILILKQFWNIDISMFLLALVMLNFFYAMHNSLRSRWNILTDALLQIFKYCSILLLHGNNLVTWKYCTMMIFAVPVIRTIEFTRKDRLNIHLFKRIDVNILRIGYHALCAAIAWIWNTNDEEAKVLLYVSIVLTLYRLVSYLMLKNNQISSIRNSNFDDVK